MMAAEGGDFVRPCKGGNIKVSIPEDNEDSDIEPRNAHGTWSLFLSFVLVSFIRDMMTELQNAS